LKIDGEVFQTLALFSAALKANVRKSYGSTVSGLAKTGLLASGIEIAFHPGFIVISRGVAVTDGETEGEGEGDGDGDGEGDGEGVGDGDTAVLGGVGEGDGDGEGDGVGEGVTEILGAPGKYRSDVGARLSLSLGLCHFKLIAASLPAL